MRRSFLLTILVGLTAGAASAQTPQPEAIRLPAEDAGKMALDHNIDLAADRLDPQISDTRVAAAAGVFRPTINTSLNSNNQLQPPSSFLIPTATRTDVMTETAGVSQRLSQFGTSYSVSWTAAHTNSNSFLNSYNPLVTSGLGLGLSQPLLRDLSIDASRARPATPRGPPPTLTAEA